MNDTPKQSAPFTLEQARAEIIGLRTMKNELGVNKAEMLYDRVKLYLTQDGEFLNDGTNPFYFNRTTSTLYKVSLDSTPWAGLMKDLGFMSSKGDNADLTYSFVIDAMAFPPRKVGRLALSTKDAIYVNAGKSRMLKVSPNDVEVVPVGSDGILLRADDLAELPVDAILSELPRVSGLIGDHTTKYLPDTPLAKLTSRFADTDHMTAEQQQQMCFTRLLFILIADRYYLYPILTHLGESRSGKSTPFEILMTMLKGEPPFLGSMPTTEGDFDATVLNKTFLMADNADRVPFDKQKVLEDRLCQVATGYTPTKRKLYTDSETSSATVRSHIFLTSCDIPYHGPDTIARTIALHMRPRNENETITKDDILGPVIADRPAMLAELLIRGQNILRAHQTVGNTRYKIVSGMDGYEKYTYICAAFEGTLAETQELWSAQIKREADAQSADNSMVHACRLFLGRGQESAFDALGKGISPDKLYQGIHQTYTQLGLKFPYTSVDKFGTHLSKQALPLKVLGYERRRSEKERLVKFTLDEAELKSCKRLYDDHYSEVLSSTKPGDAVPYNRGGRLIDKMDYDDLDITDTQTQTTKGMVQ